MASDDIEKMGLGVVPPGTRATPPSSAAGRAGNTLYQRQGNSYAQTGRVQPQASFYSDARRNFDQGNIARGLGAAIRETPSAAVANLRAAVPQAIPDFFRGLAGTQPQREAIPYQPRSPASFNPPGEFQHALIPGADGNKIARAIGSLPGRREEVSYLHPRGKMYSIRQAGAGGGGLSIAGRGTPAGMTPEEWNSLSQQDASNYRVGQLKQDIAALQDLNAVRGQAAGYGPQQAQQGGLGVYQQPQGMDMQSAVQDYLSGRVGSEGYKMFRNLAAKIDSATQTVGGRKFHTPESKSLQMMMEGLMGGVQDQMGAGQNTDLTPAAMAAFERNEIARQGMLADQQRYQNQRAQEMYNDDRDFALRAQEAMRPRGLMVREVDIGGGLLQPMAFWQNLDGTLGSQILGGAGPGEDPIVAP